MEKGENEGNDSIGITIGIDFERWKFLIRGLKQLGADNKPVDAKELETLTKVNYTTISGNLKFLHQIEFITKDSKTSAIELAPKGLEFAEAIIMKDENKQKELLVPVLKETFKDVLAFYELHILNKDLNFEMLFNQFKLLSKSPDVSGQSGNTYPANRAGIYSALKMLIFTELIDKKFHPEINSLQILRDKASQTRIKSEIPTFCSMEWMKRFFQEIRNMNPENISRAFITANVIGSHHEGSVLSIARFLGMIDKKGDRMNNYEKLRLFGDDEFKENLSQIIQEKYSKIFNVANIETVAQNNLETVFMKEYNLGQDQSHNAVKVLVNLCQLSNISISESLLNFRQTIKKEPNDRKTGIKKGQKTQSTESSVQSIMPQSIMYPMPESPFKVNLNINIDVKDKETMLGVIELVRGLKQEIKAIPELDVIVNDETPPNES